MRSKLFSISIALILVASLFGAIPRTARASVTVGPYPSTSPDSGTCGPDWANDALDRSFTDITSTSFTEWFQNGTFITIGGKSPGACNGPDNGNMVQAGVTGTFSGVFDVKVEKATQLTPEACTPTTCNTTKDFVHTVYGLGATYSSGATYFVFNYHKTCSVQTWRNASANRGGNDGDIKGGPEACPTPPRDKWFDPGDNRVDPRPGDRLSVYCNPTAKPPTVVVYGIANDQPDYLKGFYLATFANADLLKAGPGGLTKNAGNLGNVSMMQDGHGHFYVAWNDGKYGATGQGIFSKSFTCTFSAQ